MTASALADVGEGAPVAPTQPKPKLLSEYTPPPFLISDVQLDFQLEPTATLVTATLTILRNDKEASTLELDGDTAIKLVAGSVKVDGEDALFSLEDGGAKMMVTAPADKDEWTLTSTVEIDPKGNTALEGLYMSGGNFCTQCEAEGFRRITYFVDRPDVMAKFTTRITGDKNSMPVLLSNGNLVEEGITPDGKHFAVYVDPFPKPSYLFALVAGDLVFLEDKFTTVSGKEVTLRIYVREGDLDKCPHAMLSLQQSMKWDEEVYGREYDLDIFNVVAVNDFNMGAMENKSLNVFNSKYVLVSQDTATDGDYNAVQAVIGHEYFHNWTGNRVTCRDWFQLSLKEGLTVFRDQEFSGDMLSQGVNRIKNVQRLRESQFPSDAGPMAHSVRPESYLEINNFYSTTIYNKGAEVIRMLHTIVGKPGYRKGTDLYFERHDGQAVTCDDWVAAIQDANPNVDLGQFKLWYSQAGTPEVTVDVSRDGDSLTLDCTQTVPDTPGQVNKKPMVIPLVTGLVGTSASTIPVNVSGLKTADEQVLLLKNAKQTFTLTGVPEDALPSILRQFSAPIKLEVLYDGKKESLAQLAQKMAFDSDDFNRWESGQKLAKRMLEEKYEALKEGQEMGKQRKSYFWNSGICGYAGELNDVDDVEMPTEVVDAFRQVVVDQSLDKTFKAQMFSLPSENWQIDNADPVAIHEATVWFKKAIATGLAKDLKQVIDETKPAAVFSLDEESQGRRSLRATAMGLLASLDDEETLAQCVVDVASASTMTEVLSALSILTRSGGEASEKALADFYAKWKSDYLVVGKWLGIQSMVPREDTLEKVKALLDHEAFDINNPNNVYSVIGGFCMGNPFGFHSRGDESYAFLADQVIRLDPKNPQVAARMVAGFTRWAMYEKPRQLAMVAQLRRIESTPSLSKNVGEIVSKSLLNAPK